MIPFLVKLANLLDDRGQHPMAREVDDLIEKLAQIDPGQHLITLYQDAERANIAAKEKWEAAKDAANARPTNDDLRAQRDEALKQYNATMAARDKAEQEAKAYGPKPLTPQAPQTNAPAKKAPALQKKRPASNPLVKQLQKSLNSMGLGLEEDGLWGPETNSAFLDTMKNEPRYAHMVDTGKFDGNMQLAVQMIDEIAKLKGMDKPASQPQQSSPLRAPAAVKQEDDKEVPPRNGPFGGPGIR